MVVEKQRITVEEFERFADSPENKDRFFELIDGEIVEKALPTEEHGIIVLRFGSKILLFVDERKLGRVGPAGYFLHCGCLAPCREKGSIPQRPDLAVEVKSPDDRYADMRRRAEYYVKSGVRLVRLIYPEKRLVEVYRPDSDILLLNEDDMLEGFDVLPGFVLKVSEIFEP